MLHLLMYGGLAIVIAGVLFAVAVRFLPAGEQIAPPVRDEPPWDLPPDRELRADDVDAVRLPVALRGYRFAETDALLDRLAAELRARDDELARLRGNVAIADEPVDHDASLVEAAAAEEPVVADEPASREGAAGAEQPVQRSDAAAKQPLDRPEAAAAEGLLDRRQAAAADGRLGADDERLGTHLDAQEAVADRPAAAAGQHDGAPVAEPAREAEETDRAAEPAGRARSWWRRRR